MGASIGAEAISHLEEISEEGVRAMAASGSVAVILPTTAYILRLKSPPVRSMIEAGVIVALGSDFNPNAYCLEMVREIDMRYSTSAFLLSFCSVEVLAVDVFQRRRKGSKNAAISCHEACGSDNSHSPGSRIC